MTKQARIVKQMRFVLAMALLASVSTSCGSESSSPKCNLQNELTVRAGSGATNCGQVALDMGTASVDACVVNAFLNHSPFFAQYARRGTDSEFAFGVAGDRQGKVTFLLWDSDPSGGSGAAPVVTGDDCVGPSIDANPARDTSTTPPIACASTVSLGRTCG